MIRLGMVLATLLLATLPARAQSPVYQGVTIGGTGGPQIIAGAGVPTATAPAGSLYLRKDGSGAVWARIGGAWARISPAARAVGVAALAANSSAVLATIVPGAASYLRTWRVNVAVSRQDSTVTALTRSGSLEVTAWELSNSEGRLNSEAASESCCKLLWMLCS